jgi:drug/metabolite transporter (DMT)-like permease
VRNSLLYILALFSLSQAANLIRLAQAPALAIGFWRLFFSAAILLPFLLWTMKKDQKPDLKPETQQRFFLLTMVSAVFFFTHLWTFFLAAQKTSIANCMILFSLNPLFTALISSTFLKVELPKRLLVAYPIAFAGLVVLLWNDLSEHSIHSNQSLGDFSAILSGVLYSAYILTSMKVRKTTSNLKFATVMYFATSFLFFLFCLIYKIELFDYPMITWVAILGNVFIPTLMGHFLFTYLLQFLNVNLMSCGKLIEPVFSSLVAYFIFHEQLKSGIYLSFALTSLSLFILFSNQLKTSK